MMAEVDFDAAGKQIEKHQEQTAAMSKDGSDKLDIGKANQKSPRIVSGRPLLEDITNFTGSKAAQKVITEKLKDDRDYLVGLKNTNAAPSVEAMGHEAHVSNIREVMDEGAQSNTQHVTEYAADIHGLLFRDEMKFLPRSDYIETQADITSKMRSILVNWLIEVQVKFRLCAETLHLTISLVDRYLSRTPVKRKRLQLVGVVSMFIASKFEEIHPPEVRDWVYITDKKYTREKVLQMECRMLTTLNFEIVVPTAAQFFSFLANTNGCDDVHRAFAQYILELGLLDIRMLRYAPSHVASAAFLLSNKLLKRSIAWSASMAQTSRHSETSLAGCVEELRQLWEADQAGEGREFPAIHKKFSRVSRYSVAKRDCRYSVARRCCFF